jgi:hypothetical protein
LRDKIIRCAQRFENTVSEFPCCKIPSPPNYSAAANVTVIGILADSDTKKSLRKNRRLLKSPRDIGFF